MRGELLPDKIASRAGADGGFGRRHGVGVSRRFGSSTAGHPLALHAGLLLGSKGVPPSSAWIQPRPCKEGTLAWPLERIKQI